MNVQKFKLKNFLYKIYKKYINYIKIHFLILKFDKKYY